MKINVRLSVAFNVFVCTIFYILVVAAAVGHFEGFKLPQNYSKHYLPSKHLGSGDQMFVVHMSAIIVDILQVDELNNEVMLDICVFRLWPEHRVQLELSEMKPGVRYPLDQEDAKLFWTPDFYVKRMRRYQMAQDFSRILLLSDKTVIQSLRMDLLIKCKFHFELFPLDIQECPLDFLSALHSADELVFNWRKGNKSAVRFWKPEELSLYNYMADIIICDRNFTDRALWGTVSALRFWLVLKRNIKPYILDTFVPTTLFVIMSWGSFLVKPDIVPGRMVLLVTNILSLVTFFEAVRRTAPPSTGIKGMDVWLLSCIVFVFLALLEYAIILSSMQSAKRTSARTQNLNLKLFYVAELNTIPVLPHFLFRCQEWCKKMRRKVSPLIGPKLVGNYNCLDRLSLKAFPVVFVAYTILFWTVCYSKSRHDEEFHICPHSN